MSKLLKRFKKQKSSERETDSKIREGATHTPDNDFDKSVSLSPISSDSDVSPQHFISEGSLFSGMKLTKSSRELEPESSPYTITPTPDSSSSTGDQHIDSEQKFNFIERTTELKLSEEVSSFSFLNQPVLDDEDEVENNQTGSGFSFLNQSPAVPAPEEEEQKRDANTTKSSNFTFLSEAKKDITETPSSGFTFLTKKDDLSDRTPSLEPHHETNQLDVITEASEKTSLIGTDSKQSIDVMKSGEESMVVTSTSEPSSSVPVSPSTASPTPTGMVSQKVGRQLPPSKKRKKHKAIRPGQERSDEIYSGVMESSITSDLDGISIDSHESLSTVESSVKAEEEVTERKESTKDDVIITTDPKPIEGTTAGDIKEIDSTVTNSDSTSNEISGKAEDTICSNQVDVKPNDTELVNSPPIEDNTSNTAKGKDEVPSGNTAEGKDEVPSGNLVQVDEEEAGTNNVSTTERNSVELMSSDLVDVFNKVSEGESKIIVSDTSNYTLELSPLEKMTTLVETSDSNAKFIRNNIDELKVQYGTVLEDNSQVVKQLTEKRKKIKELKDKEAAALSDENYELAEELRQELETINILNNRELLINTQKTVEKWLKQCSESISSQIELHIEVKEKLTNLKNEQENALSGLEKEFSSTHAKEKIKLQTLRDELEREKGHIALDREHVEKRQQLLKDEVSERAAEFILCKRNLEAEEKETQNEIEALESKLHLLKERQRDLLARIHSEDIKIEEVSQEFSSEHEQLKLEQSRVDTKEEELQEQVSSLNKLQLSYDASLELHSKSKESVQSVLEQTDEKILEHSNSQKLLEDAIAKSSDWTFEDAGELLKPTDSLQSLLNNEKFQEDEVKKATSEVMSLQASITAQCRKVTDQEMQLQKVQEAKKVAVSARQYREAAKLSAEEKQVLSEIDSEKKEISAMEEELAKKNATLLALNEELDNVREEREKAERDADIESIKKLVLFLSTVRSRSKCFKLPFLLPVFTQWDTFITLIIEDMCVKHGLDLTDYLVKEDPLPNDDTSCSLLTESKGDETVEGVENAALFDEERTPGVGMEVPDEPKTGMVAELTKNIEDLEKRIAECCEHEEFEQAADLDEELKELKSKLTAMN